MANELASAPIQFQGEWLWLGNTGHAVVILAFVASLLAAFAFYKASQDDSGLWMNWAKRFFVGHSMGVLGIVIVLFSLIFFHRFEYYYVWRHSSLALPTHYMISCFWEGQEGSFLLWMFWNSVIGLVLLRQKSTFTAPVMAVMAFAEVALSSMLLGVEWGSFHLGSSPFELLRSERPDFLQIPILGSLGVGNYLQVITDGNGLNPLLQNYWMVIHPPTLFFGFATATVPFAYSLAGLWKGGQDRSWIRPALIWSLVCTGILGLGIIMGGYWAYESLNFGGYWAWDPVENASLMPWLLMAAAAHMLLISKSTGKHLFSAHLLVHLSFWLVLYATFLTRSGILGEASVHSFTDLGLSGQLLLFLLAFIGLSWWVSHSGSKGRSRIGWGMALALIGIPLLSLVIPESASTGFSSGLKWGGILLFSTTLVGFIQSLMKETANADSAENEDRIDSREFWMFLGAMFLILSLVQVFFATSIPVFNKLFGFKTAVPQAADYNRVQLWLAMPVMALMAMGHWFRFRQTDPEIWIKGLFKTVGLSLGMSFLLAWALEIFELGYFLFLFFSVYLITANAWYALEKKKKTWLGHGSSIAHLGFGVLLLGVLISSVNQRILTASTGIGMAPERNEKGEIDSKGIEFNRENAIVYKGRKAPFSYYQVEYKGARQGAGNDSINEYFLLSFRDTGSGDSFVLEPKTQNNPKMGLLAEPDTRHFLNKDIFTHVSYQSSLDKTEPFAGFKNDTLRLGQTFTTSSAKLALRLDSFSSYPSPEGLIVKLKVAASQMGFGSGLESQYQYLYPQFKINTQSGAFESAPVESNELGLFLSIQHMKILDPNPKAENLEFVMQTGEKKPVIPYVVVKSIEFPWINAVWAGTILMVLGFAMSIAKRIREQRQLLA